MDWKCICGETNTGTEFTYRQYCGNCGKHIEAGIATSSLKSRVKQALYKTGEFLEKVVVLGTIPLFLPYYASCLLTDWLCHETETDAIFNIRAIGLLVNIFYWVGSVVLLTWLLSGGDLG